MLLVLAFTFGFAVGGLVIGLTLVTGSAKDSKTVQPAAITLTEALELDKRYGGIYVIPDSSAVAQAFHTNQDESVKFQYRAGEKDVLKDGINVIVLNAILDTSR